MEGLLLSSRSSLLRDSGGVVSVSDDTKPVTPAPQIPSLLFPVNPTIQMNDVISSLLQYKELCNSVKSEPVSPLYSPKASSKNSSGTVTSPIVTSPTASAAKSPPGIFNNPETLKQILPTTSTTSSAFLPTTGSLLNNTFTSSTPSILGSESLLSTTNTLLSNGNPANYLGSSLLASTPTTTSFLSGNPLLSQSNGLLTSNLLTSSPFSQPKQCKKEPVQIVPVITKTSSLCGVSPANNTTPTSGVPVTKSGATTSSATSGVKIFQTKQGYTLLICNGYRYSKISTSSNGKKVYWRCTLRSCKGKVHTDVGGGVVYESTHDHPPMAEEFLFSCHSNRLAKEARQIMRFDPMKCLKDDAPYSALESTPTFCKIKDCLNVRSKNYAASPNGKKDGLVGPTMPKPTLAVPALTANPTPALKITPTKDGSLSVESPTNGLLTELNTLRLTQNLCDVALCVSGTIIYAHRVVLAAASQYFRLLFLSNTKLLSYVELRGVKPESVELLVNYAYTGNLEINYNRVTELLTAANLLQFNPVVEKCCDYLRTQITVNNCINMREYAATQGLTKFQDLIDKYVCLHWEKVITHDEIYDARPETLLHFLGHDELAVDNEADVYKVIITWVRKSPLYRQFYVGELLRKVRFVQLNAQFLLDNIESEELIRQHRDCEALLHRAKNHFLLPDRDHGLEEYHFRKRKRKNNVCLFGREGNITVGYEYNTVKCTAKRLCSVDLDNKNYALVNTADSLFLVGGESSDGLYLSDIVTYNHRDNTWSYNPDLKLSVARSQINATRVGIQIYLCGGMSTSGPCDTVEVIDVLTHQVSEAKSLPEALAGAISCVVDNDIFITGGLSEKGNNYSFYMYNHSLQLWTDLPKIPVVEGTDIHVTAMLHNVDSMIYIVMSDSSLYRFNITTRTWNVQSAAEAGAAEDGLPLNYLTSCTTNGDIFAIRSRGEKMFLDRFDGSSITWSTCYSVDLPILVDAICPKPSD